MVTYEIFTNESRHERILVSKEGGQATPRLAETMEQLANSISIRVIATYPLQALVMAATSPAGHLKIHWDDTSYNPFYSNKDAAYWDTIANKEKASNQAQPHSGACLHLWFLLHTHKAAQLSQIRIDKCIDKCI